MLIGYMPLHQDDSLEETTYFKLRLHSLAIIILHDDILTQSVDGSGAMASISVQQMKSQAEKFFNDLGIFHIGGGIDRDLQVAHEKLSATCKANHLR